MSVILLGLAVPVTAGYTISRVSIVAGLLVHLVMRHRTAGAESRGAGHP